MPRGGCEDKGGGNLKGCLVLWEENRNQERSSTSLYPMERGSELPTNRREFTLASQIRALSSTVDSGSLFQLPANQTLGSSGDDSVAGCLAPTWETQMGAFVPWHWPSPKSSPSCWRHLGNKIVGRISLSLPPSLPPSLFLCLFASQINLKDSFSKAAATAYVRH